MIESALLLFLVIDPFGNLPFVLAVIGDAPAARYRRIILRETVIAFAVLALFVLAGDRVLGYLQIEAPSLEVAGGVILFLISLKMIFRTSAEIFDHGYGADPWLVPIAVPALAGPSSITTVMILRSQQAGVAGLLLAALAVLVVTGALFLAGRRLSVLLGPRGMSALEKLMGLLLNLVAVDMMLTGTRDFLGL